MVGHFCRDSAQSSLQREIAIVLVTRDCPRTFPSRGTTQVYREQLCLVVADADVSGANSSPYGPLNTTRRAAVPERLLARGHHIQGHIRVGPNGRDLEVRGAARIEQPAPNLGS